MPESAATNAASYTTPWDTITAFRAERPLNSVKSYDGLKALPRKLCATAMGEAHRAA